MSVALALVLSLANPCITCDTEENQGRDLWVFGLFIKSRNKKSCYVLLRAASLSTECCLYFSFLTLILTNWLVKERETVLLTAAVGPQADVKLTAGGSRSHPLLPLDTFDFGPDVEYGRARVEDFKDRGPGHETGPHPLPPSTNTQKGTHVTWMFDRLMKNRVVTQNEPAP